MERRDGAILVLDVETTGTDPTRDQIIELSIQSGLTDGSPGETWRFRPAVPIHPQAQALHGICMDDLAGCNAFAAHAASIRRIIQAATILGGYNLRFDLGMLGAEFGRLNAPPLDLSGKIQVDPLRLWRQHEPRTLEGAHARFVGRPLIGAHGADADTAATARVLLGMLDAFDLEGKGWPDIAGICEPDRHLWIGPSHHIQWRDDVPTLMFGRHRGTPLAKLATERDGDYLRWMLRRDFPQHVNAICMRALELDADALQEWLADAFRASQAVRRKSC